MKKLHVLVVEESQLNRQQIATLIGQTPDMEVVGECRSDPAEVLTVVQSLQPDLISVGLRSSRPDGLNVTRWVMSQQPVPIVMVGQEACDATLRELATQSGALAVVEKLPPPGHPQFSERAANLLQTFRLMAGVRVVRHRRDTGPLQPPNPESVAKGSTPYKTAPLTPAVVVIGASAGGPGALMKILGNMPPEFRLPILLVQHFKAEFMPALVEWLVSVSALRLRLAVDGEPLTPGVVLVAPGNYHMRIDNNRRIALDPEQGPYRHHPAVDVLMETASKVFGPRAIGVLLTGMGNDGAAGLLAMRSRGARTIAQDEQSSVVFGMPAAAIELDAAEYVVHIDHIADVIQQLVTNEGTNHVTISSPG